ncbi:MAG: hypothetical protein ACXVKQ_20235 [Acidimicrobiia bacterium]
MFQKAIRAFPLLLVTASLALGAQAADAATERHPRTVVMVLPAARVSRDGATITARVLILCQPNGIQWEGFATVAQGDLSVLGGMPLACDGRPHVEAVAISRNDPETSFHRGQATVSAFILDEGTLEVHARDTRTVVVFEAHRGTR